jgi:hypothetical protein
MNIVYGLEQSYNLFLPQKQLKNKSLFFIVAISAKFSAICQDRDTIVPKKFDVMKLWHFAQKIRTRVVAKSAGSGEPVFISMY